MIEAEVSSRFRDGAYDICVGRKVVGRVFSLPEVEVAVATTKEVIKRPWWSDVGADFEGVTYVVQTYFAGSCAVYAGMSNDDFEAEQVPPFFIEVTEGEITAFDGYRFGYAAVRNSGDPEVERLASRYEAARKALGRRVGSMLVWLPSEKYR